MARSENVEWDGAIEIGGVDLHWLGWRTREFIMHHIPGHHTWRFPHLRRARWSQKWEKKFWYALQREQKSSGLVHQQPRRDFQFAGHENFSCSVHQSKEPYRTRESPSTAPAPLTSHLAGATRPGRTDDGAWSEQTKRGNGIGKLLARREGGDGAPPTLAGTGEGASDETGPWPCVLATMGNCVVDFSGLAWGLRLLFSFFSSEKDFSFLFIRYISFHPWHWHQQEHSININMLE
jgi:hypothetical protein